MQADATNPDVIEELAVTFHPPLFLQRRGWVLDIMRRERVSQVLDVGCGEGDLIACLCNPAPWLLQPPMSVLPPSALPSMPGRRYMDYTLHPQSDLQAQEDLEVDDFLHVAVVHGLDISTSDLEGAVEAISTKDMVSIPKWLERPRWEPLTAKIWNGGLQVYNPQYVDIECIVATEVIEHLPEDVLADFAPVLLGLYHPQMLLVTTPSYTFNARFTPPDAPPGTRKGYLDPTGRTNRIFRHDDHRFEWTVEEFEEWCRAVAESWDYDVEISGVGRSQEDDPWGRDLQLGYASQTAAFWRREGVEYIQRRARRCQTLELVASMSKRELHILLAETTHVSHPSTGKPAPASKIATAIKTKMAEFRTNSLTIRELWFEEDISSMCGGWVEVLVAAAKQQDDLVLSQPLTDYGYTWEVSFPNFVPRSPSPLSLSPEVVCLDEDSEEYGENEETAWSIESETVVYDCHPAISADTHSSWPPDPEKLEWEDVYDVRSWRNPDIGWGQEGVVGSSKT